LRMTLCVGATLVVALVAGRHIAREDGRDALKARPYDANNEGAPAHAYKKSSTAVSAITASAVL
jgi:hypothetical protein